MRSSNKKSGRSLQELQALVNELNHLDPDKDRVFERELQVESFHYPSSTPQTQTALDTLYDRYRTELIRLTPNGTSPKKTARPLQNQATTNALRNPQLTQEQQEELDVINGEKNRAILLNLTLLYLKVKNYTDQETTILEKARLATQAVITHSTELAHAPEDFVNHVSSLQSRYLNALPFYNARAKKLESKFKEWKDKYHSILEEKKQKADAILSQLATYQTTEEQKKATYELMQHYNLANNDIYISFFAIEIPTFISLDNFIKKQNDLLNEKDSSYKKSCILKVYRLLETISGLDSTYARSADFLELSESLTANIKLIYAGNEEQVADAVRQLEKTIPQLQVQLKQLEQHTEAKEETTENHIQSLTQMADWYIAELASFAPANEQKKIYSTKIQELEKASQNLKELETFVSALRNEHDESAELAKIKALRVRATKYISILADLSEDEAKKVNARTAQLEQYKNCAELQSYIQQLEGLVSAKRVHITPKLDELYQEAEKIIVDLMNVEPEPQLPDQTYADDQPLPTPDPTQQAKYEEELTTYQAKLKITGTSLIAPLLTMQTEEAVREYIGVLSGMKKFGLFPHPNTPKPTPPARKSGEKPVEEFIYHVSSPSLKTRSFDSN